MNTVFKPLYLPGADRQELKPSFAQTMSSAFNLENDMVNLYDSMTRPVFEPDPAFNFKSTFEGAKLPIDWMPLLATAQSQPEFNALLGRVQKEYQDKAVLAASGWTGTVAALGAGILSPTVFIPFAGPSRGLKGMAEVVALAAVGATAQNAALFYNQSTRTEAEFYSGVAMDTLLMGMMGGAWLGLNGRARAKLADDIPYRSEVYDIPEAPSDLPGRVAEKRFDLNEEGVLPAQRPAFVENEIRPVYSKEPDLTSNAPNARQLVAYKNDEVVGAVEGEVVGKTVKIYNSSLKDDLVGNDVDTSLYEEFIGKAMDEGLAVVSDDTVSASTARVYKSLEKLGYKIAKSEAVETKADGTLQTTDSSPVFRVEKRPPVSQPDMAVSKVDEAIPSARDTQSVGAATARTRNTLGAKAAPNRVRQAAMDALGRISPSYRMLTNKAFASLRHGIAKIDMSGIQQAGLAGMEPSARGGTVIERIRGYDYHIVKFAKTLDKNYYRYVHGTDEGFDFGSPAITQLKSVMGILPGGKMNWNAYKEAIFDAQNTGEIPPDIADSVSAFRDFFKEYTSRQTQYLEEMAAAGLDVKPLFKELKTDEMGKGIVDYAHHIFSKQKLMDNMGEFLDDFTRYNEDNLKESFGKAKVRLGKKRTKLQLEKAIAEMDETQISGRLNEVEGDLEFLEELPEWREFRESRLALNKRAKDEGWSKEQLKEAQKELQDGLTDDVKALQEDRKTMMALAKTLRKYGGDSAAQTEKLKAEIDKADEMIDEMFRSEIPGIRRADLSIARLQEQGDKMLAPVTKALENAVKMLGKRQARMNTLLNSKRANTASRAKVAELIEKSKVRHEAMLERLSAVKGKQVANDVKLSELNLLREDVIAETTSIVRKRALKLEDLEDRLEAEAKKVLTPEERTRMRDQVGEELDNLDGDFQQLWSKRGERSGDPVNTEAPDFSEKAREMAVMLHQKLMNTEVELSPAYRALRQDARGAELLRVMKIPYNIKQKWLEKDVELVTRAYDRVMAPDLELWRAFDGSVNAKSLLGEMQEEVTEHLTRINTAKFVKLPKGWVDNAAKFSQRVKDRLTDLGEADNLYLEPSSFANEAKEGFVPLTTELRNQLSGYINDAAAAATRDVDVAIQRLRHTRGVPDDPKSFMWRAGRSIKNLNVLTMMGSVVPNSVSDIARPIWRHGVMRTLGHGWKPFINKLNPEAKAFRIRSKDINRRIGLNLEPMLHSRAQGVFDLAEDSIGRTKLERGLALGANKMGLIAMYDYWTAGMKTIAGNVFHATMAEYVPAVADAWAKNAEFTGDLLQMRTYLRNLGLSDLDIHRIGTQMKQPGGVERFSNGGVLPNLDVWDDMAAYQAYQAAGLKEVNELIVTPGLEKPNWVDENMGYSMVAQFKAFTFASNSRMVMSGLQGNDPFLMQGLAFSLAFGALSYYTYAVATGGKTLEEANQMDAEKWIWESIKRGGVLGALSLGTDVASNIPSVSGAEPTIFTKPSGLLGAFLGPTYAQAEKLATAISQAGSDDDKQKARNMRALRQVFIPFQNHFLARQLLDRVGDALYGAN